MLVSQGNGPVETYLATRLLEEMVIRVFKTTVREALRSMVKGEVLPSYLSSVVLHVFKACCVCRSVLIFSRS